VEPRCLIKFGLFVLVGAIANVAVAWGSVFVIDPQTGQEVRYDADGLATDFRWRWGATVWSALGTTRIWYYEGHTCGLQRDTDPPNLSPLIPWWSERSFEIEGVEKNIPVQEARGWPALTLWCEYSYGSPDYSWRSRPELGGVTAPFPSLKPWTASDRFHRALPLRPISTGFAINTIFYASLIWLLLAAPFAIRRRIRIKQGRCDACGYPIGASDNCTECGSVVKRRSIDH
jgi:hypothetical protein